MAQFVYLGHVVVSGLVKPESTKIQAVQQTPPPQQVRAFLGLTGYYRHFIPDYATIAAPVSDLTERMPLPMLPELLHANVHSSGSRL